MIKLLPLFFSTILFGASVDIANTDIIERIINFIIFIAIMWYLLADKIKLVLSQRRDNIVSNLSRVESDLADSKLRKEEAVNALQQAKDKASQMINLANKEALVLSKKIEDQCNIDINLLNKHFVELHEFERQKMKREVIENFISDLLNDDISLDKKDYLNILIGKVA